MPENRTVRRLRHVQKVYGHIPGVVGATVSIVTGGRLGGYFDESVSVREAMDATFVPGIPQIRDLGPRTNPYIPWIAREVRRIGKENEARVRSGERPGWNGCTVHNWPQEWLIVRDWLAAHPQDTTQLRWRDAYNQSFLWHQEMEERERYFGPVTQAPVLARLMYGWTAQELNTHRLLYEEGQSMNHCVEDYWSDVEQGIVKIVSLRDKEGVPHVTIEFNLTGSGEYVVQIRGGANSIPKPEYHEIIAQAIDRLTTPEQRSMLTRYFSEGPAEVWKDEATEGWDQLDEWIEHFDKDKIAVELRSLLKDRSTCSELEDGFLKFEYVVRAEDLDEIQDWAQDAFTEDAFSIKDLPDDFDLDEAVMDAWDEGSNEGWISSFSGFDFIVDDGGVIFRLRFPAWDRKAAEKGLSVRTSWKGHPMDSEWEEDAKEWLKDVESAVEGLGQAMVDRAHRKLWMALP